MAKKRRPSPLDEPPSPTASSEDEQQPSSQQQEGEEEEEEDEEEQQQQEASSGEEEASSDEEDQPPSLSQTASKNPPPPSTNSHPKPSSSSESESGSDSESQPDDAPPPPPPNPKVKPLASKPMDQNPKTKAQALAQSSPAPTRSGTKRAVENNNAHVNGPKRAKKKATDTTAAGGSDDEMEADDDGKKSGDDSRKMFQRVWSEEDEVTILKGLADFTSKTGNDPVKFITAFYESVKKLLHLDASCNQLKQKVRRLKDKYKVNAEKAKNGEDPIFPKPHEQKLFELSKKIWGNGPNDAEEKGKPNGKPAKSPKKEASRRTTASAKKQPPTKKPVAETREEPDSPAVVAVKESGEVETEKVGDSSVILSEMFRFDKGVGLNGLNEDVVKRGVELIGESKKAELEGRWKKLQVAELELFVKRAQLIEDQARLILEAYKSSSH